MDSGTLSDDALGEVDINLDLLEMPEDGEKNEVSLDALREGKVAGQVVVSLSRKEAPKGAFTGLVHVRVHSIDEFPDRVGMISTDTTDPYVKLQLMGGKPQKTSVKNNAGGTNVVFNEVVSFFDKGLFENILTITVMDSNMTMDETLGEVVVDLNQLDVPNDRETEKTGLEVMKLSNGKVAGKIYLSFSRMAMPEGSFTGVLHLTVCRIDEFSDTAGFMDKTDPYVKVLLGNEEFKTTVKDNSGGKATWNETFSFSKQLFDNLLRVEVYDKDTLSDDFLGSGNIDLHAVDAMPTEGAEGKDEVAVQTVLNGKPAGKVFVKFSRKNAF